MLHRNKLYDDMSEIFAPLQLPSLTLNRLHPIIHNTAKLCTGMLGSSLFKNPYCLART